MSETDISHRFIINDRGVRGQWTLLEASYQTVLAKHNYPLELQAVLGEMMAAAILLSATLKFEGSMVIQARGNGAVSLLSVECSHDYKLRAIARWEGDTSGLDFRSLLGQANLAITITPAQGERYQGIVPLDGDTLSQCLEHYFDSSEQIRTKIQLFHGNNRAGGLLLQILPTHSGIKLDPLQQQEEWERVTALAQTLTAEELLNLDCTTVLHRLFHEEDVQLFPAETVCFECSCSRQRTSEALVQMGRPELEQILQEEGNIEVVCQFCNEMYRFDAVDIALLFSDYSPTGGADDSLVN